METLRKKLFGAFVIASGFLIGLNNPVLAEEQDFEDTVIYTDTVAATNTNTSATETVKVEEKQEAQVPVVEAPVSQSSNEVTKAQDEVTSQKTEEKETSAPTRAPSNTLAAGEEPTREGEPEEYTITINFWDTSKESTTPVKTYTIAAKENITVKLTDMIPGINTSTYSFTEGYKTYTFKGWSASTSEEDIISTANPHTNYPNLAEALYGFSPNNKYKRINITGATTLTRNVTADIYIIWDVEDLTPPEPDRKATYHLVDDNRRGFEEKDTVVLVDNSMYGHTFTLFANEMFSYTTVTATNEDGEVVTLYYPALSQQSVIHIEHPEGELYPETSVSNSPVIYYLVGWKDSAGNMIGGENYVLPEYESRIIKSIEVIKDNTPSANTHNYSLRIATKSKAEIVAAGFNTEDYDIYFTPVFQGFTTAILDANYIDNVDTGSGSWQNPSGGVVEYSHTFKNPEDGTPKYDYEFLYWQFEEIDDDQIDSNKEYKAGDVFTYDLFWKPDKWTETVNAYAWWQPAITLNLYNDSESMSTNNDHLLYTSGYKFDKAEITINPTRQGYDFVGWVDENGNIVTDTIFNAPAPSKEVPNAEEGVNVPVVVNLFAKWKRTEETITVSKVWDDESNDAKHRPVGEEEPVVLELYATKEGETLAEDAEPAYTVELTGTKEENTWSQDLTIFPYDAEGNKLVYSIKEKDSILSYVSTPSVTTDENGKKTYTVTNTVKADGTVIVKHLDIDTGEPIAPEETITDSIDQPYETAAITTNPLYAFAEMAEGSAPATGAITAEAKTVIYLYERTIGSIKIHHVDVNGNYITRDKNNALVEYRREVEGTIGEAYTAEPITIYGYENIATDGTDFNGGEENAYGVFEKQGVFTREGFDIFFVYKEADGKVIVHYMDVTDPENQVEIDREEATGKVSDDNYTTIVKEIENYTLVEKEEPQIAQTVTFKEDTIEITYEYIKNKGVVNVYYMDVTDPENPVEMDSDVIDNQYIDSEYRTTEKTFEHFTLVETPANATGTVKGTPTNVIYNYVRNVGKVIVHYIDVTDPENPVEMATEEYSGKVALEDEEEPDTYTTEAKTFTHYELIDPEEDYTGTFAEDTLDLIYSYVWRDGQVTVHYMDVTDPENPVEIISDDTKYGAVDSSYEVTPQTHEELTNYTLVGDSGNRVGVYTENAIEVYFNYIKKIGSVIVYHIDADTNEEIVTNETLTGYVGDEYESSSLENIDPYVLVEPLPENANGTYTEDEQTVTYYYKKRSGVVEVYYKDLYTGKVIEGQEVKEMPGYVDEQYTVEIPTIEGYEYVRAEPEELLTGNYPDGIVEKITLYYQKVGKVITHYYEVDTTNSVADDVETTGLIGTNYLTKPAENVEGYSLVATPENATGEYSEELQEIIYYYQRLGRIVTHFLDNNGNVLADPVEEFGVVGEEYTTTPINIDGYELTGTPENATGEFAKEDIDVNYIYSVPTEPVEPEVKYGTVIVHYVDEDGNELIDAIPLVGEVGTEYRAPEIPIAGYTLIDAVRINNTRMLLRALPAGKPNVGLFEEVKFEINMVYSKNEDPTPETGKVVVLYTDTEGYTIADREEIPGNVGDEYITTQLRIDGYKISEVKGERRGTISAGTTYVEYIYEKVEEEPSEPSEPTTTEQGTVIAYYIDGNGNNIAEPTIIPGTYGTTYITYQKVIAGYVGTSIPENRIGKIEQELLEIYYSYEKVEDDESSSSCDNNCGCSSCNSCSCNNCNCNNEEQQPTIIINNNITNENNNDNSSNNSSTNTSASNVENNNDNSTEVNNENNNQDENNVTNENNLVNNNEVTTGDTNVENNVTTGDTNVQTGDTTVTTGDTTIENNPTVENNTNVETGDTTIENNPTNTVETGDTTVTTGDTNVENNTSVENNPTNNVENNTEVDASSSNENNNSSESNPTVTNTSESNPVINLDNSSESNPNVETTTSIENNPTNTNEANPTNNVDVVVDPTINNESGATNTNESNSSNNNESNPVNNNDGSNTNINENNDTNSCEDEKCNEKQEQDSTSTDEPKTGKVIVRYLDEEGYTISPTVTIDGNVNDDYVTDQLRINGYEIDRVEGETEDSIKEEPTYVTYYYKTAAADSPKQGQVLVHYVDEEGKAIANDEVINGTVGEQYIAIEKVIAGYELLDVVKVNRAPVRLMLRALPAGSPNVGTITEELIELNFIYQAVEAEEEPSCSTCGNTTVIVNCDSCDKEDEQSQGEPKKGTVITYYFDSEGNALETEETTTGKVDDEYQTSPKEIKGYKLLRVVGQPEGNYIEGQQVVIYIYQAENTIVEELGNLEVHHVDTDGNELAETETSTDIVGNPYQTSPKEILDYKVLRVDGDPEGTYVAGTTIVTYVYEKVTDEESSDPVQSKVIVNYVDINGKKISGRVIFIGTVGTEWKSFEKTIDGYYLVRVEGNTEGLYTTEEQEVTYVYESLNGEGNTDIEPEPTEPEAKPGKVDGAKAEIKPPKTLVDKNLNNVYFLIVSLIYGLITYTKKRTN